jgi:hypothetical protein
MTEEEREKLINDMEIAIFKEGVGTILHSSQLSRMASAALAVAEEAISKDSRARIAELEAALKPFANAADHFKPDSNSDVFAASNGHKLYYSDLLNARAALKGER